ncbi:hypothetical protein EI555_020664, partial [Monodon monoceros]
VLPPPALSARQNPEESHASTQQEHLWPLSAPLQLRPLTFFLAASSNGPQNTPLAKDLLHPSPEEKRKHKKKRLVQSPNSYFVDVKCPGCYKITTVFSRAQTVLCAGCSTVLCQPTGGKARLTGGCSFRQRQH